MLEKELFEMLEEIDYLKSTLIELAVYEELNRVIIDEKREKLVKDVVNLADKLNKISLDLNNKFWDYKKYLWEKEKESLKGGGEVGRGTNSKRTNK